MKTILLVCSDGMSTSFLTNKMNDIAKEKNLDLKIYAKSETAIEEELNDIDVLLLGPQIAYLEEKIKDRVKGKVPVASISVLDFGRLNAVAILKQAVQLMKERE